jgi:diguanylate cyclase (GGDEF)-like protein
MRKSSDRTPSLLDVTGGDRFYAARLKQLLRLDLDEAAAQRLWAEVSRHRGELTRRLGRDVGQRVALLDYVTNVSPRVVEPQIIERDALAAIEHRAIRDPLTGLFNREYFEASLLREAERCKRGAGHAALLLLDLDRFKLVNDGQGHRKGDEVLRAVGTIVRDQVRAVDVPCRYGGDELAAVLTDTDELVAHRVAERIRTEVEERFRRAPVAVTVSVGIGLLLPTSPSSEEAFGKADRAVYAAKRAGGNRVVLAEARTSDAT